MAMIFFNGYDLKNMKNDSYKNRKSETRLGEAWVGNRKFQGFHPCRDAGGHFHYRSPGGNVAAAISPPISRTENPGKT